MFELWEMLKTQLWNCTVTVSIILPPRYPCGSKKARGREGMCRWDDPEAEHRLNAQWLSLDASSGEAHGVIASPCKPNFDWGQKRTNDRVGHQELLGVIEAKPGWKLSPASWEQPVESVAWGSIMQGSPYRTGGGQLGGGCCVSSLCGSLPWWP